MRAQGIFGEVLSSRNIVVMAGDSNGIVLLHAKN
jgi:hypothetical protein